MSFPLSAKGDLTLYPDFTYQVLFGDSREDVECDVRGIGEIYGFVVDHVIPLFARFF